LNPSGDLFEITGEDSIGALKSEIPKPPPELSFYGYWGPLPFFLNLHGESTMFASWFS
jgi:hypothetical protein